MPAGLLEKGHYTQVHIYNNGFRMGRGKGVGKPDSLFEMVFLKQKKCLEMWKVADGMGMANANFAGVSVVFFAFLDLVNHVSVEAVFLYTMLLLYYFFVFYKIGNIFCLPGNSFNIINRSI